MSELRTEFENHLRGLGYQFGVPRRDIFALLRQRMGDERFKELAILDKGVSSVADQERLYSLFDDIVEGNLLRSLDPGAAVECSYNLYQRCASQLVPHARVIELGCWTGGLASFIASRHPHCTVVGVDGARRVIDACQAYYRLPNLGFEYWNYRFGRPASLEPADVLLCSLGVSHSGPNNAELLDPREVRRSKEYVEQRDQAVGYFGLWRSAARDGAMLYAVLRLMFFPRFLAWIDAAQQAGWTPRLDRMWHVEMKERNLTLPGLVFEAAPSVPLDERVLIERWTWFECGEPVCGKLEGGVALATFRDMPTKQVLHRRQYRVSGMITGDEVGVTEGGVGYLFTWNTRTRYRLLLISRQKSDELAAGIAVPGSSTPITDQATFSLDAGAGAGTVAQTGRDGRAPPARTGSPFFGGTSPIAGTIDDAG